MESSRQLELVTIDSNAANDEERLNGEDDPGSSPSGEEKVVDVSGNSWDLSPFERLSPTSSTQGHYFYHNTFHLIPRSIGGLGRLKMLKFFTNEIEIFPPEIRYLKQLESLQVKVSLPGLSGISLQKLKSLRDLKLCRNLMTGECPPMWLLDDHFRRLSLAEPSDEASPMSVLGFQDNRLGRKCPSVNDKRLTLPKIISIRSTSYLKIPQMGGSSSESNSNIRHRPTTPVMKVRVGGAEKKDGGEAEDAVELDVYSQGMFKTELCNKWQETGQCPYGKHFHFAHGIGELHPIIQHPRYKTELCSMVLIGDNCPYRHRCHFRHSISQHDRLPRPT